jgi:hypothetical protein
MAPPAEARDDVRGAPATQGLRIGVAVARGPPSHPAPCRTCGQGAGTGDGGASLEGSRWRLRRVGCSGGTRPGASKPITTARAASDAVVTRVAPSESTSVARARNRPQNLVAPHSREPWWGHGRVDHVLTARGTQGDVDKARSSARIPPDASVPSLEVTQEVGGRSASHTHRR